jgi:RNA 3'-terminal phosphate cyclase (ATP)
MPPPRTIEQHMSKLLQLDGAEGGGQMLRTALSLAMITGLPFRMTNIRGARSKPGLMRQHLTCVRAACEISNGTADGAEIGSTELVFRAGKVRAGSYHFAIGTAGSTSLLFQTLLPALWQAEMESSLVLEGGTHNPSAPPYEFLDRVFLPAVSRMGGKAEVALEETGFAPAGGGRIRATISPSPALSSFDWHEAGDALERRITVLSRRIKPGVAHRLLESAREVLGWEEGDIEKRDDGPGAGVCLLVEQRFERGTELFSAFGEPGVTAERVGQRAAKTMKDFLGCGVLVGRYLADQLLIPMALARGGSFSTMNPGNHVRTNIEVIQKFLPADFRITDEGRGRYVIACS